MQLLNLVEATLESLIKFSSIRLFNFQKLESHLIHHNVHFVSTFANTETIYRSLMVATEFFNTAWIWMD
jgi:hypothetical protein